MLLEQPDIYLFLVNPALVHFSFLHALFAILKVMYCPFIHCMLMGDDGLSRIKQTDRSVTLRVLIYQEFI